MLYILARCLILLDSILLPFPLFLIFSLKPMSEEQSILIPHEYDGIQELNNPTPGWFMYLFYATMIFAVGYLLIYHVFGVGQLQYDEYKTEIAVAAKEKAAYLAKSADNVDENTVKLSTDAAALAAGKATFEGKCAPCHGNNGQGVVGPNLTDDYWLHGNKINDIFKTIKYGVQSKGMPTWQTQLTPKQISDVANYIKSLHGTNPANPKEPQGEKVAEDNSSAPTKEVKAKTAMVVKYTIIFKNKRDVEYRITGAAKNHGKGKAQVDLPYY